MGQIMPGTYGEFVFDIVGYQTDAFSTPITTPTTTAGHYVYIGIAPTTASGWDNSEYTYAVKDCTFRRLDSVADPTNDKTAVLFDYNNGQCANTFIDLTLSFSGDKFQIQHRLFVFGQDTTSTYTLTCNVKLCELDNSAECDAIRAGCGL